MTTSRKMLNFPLYATHLADLLGRNEASIKLHFTFLRFLPLMIVCLHRIPSSSFGRSRSRSLLGVIISNSPQAAAQRRA